MIAFTELQKNTLFSSLLKYLGGIVGNSVKNHHQVFVKVTKRSLE